MNKACSTCICQAGVNKCVGGLCKKLCPAGGACGKQCVCPDETPMCDGGKCKVTSK